jgi:protein-S-isoprenylcysteine O-methyltransferase Ste14
MRRLVLALPPPLLFVLALLAGLRLHAHDPLPLAPSTVMGVVNIAGTLGLVLGIGIVLSAVARFIHLRTTIVPHRRARALVTSGPFRWSRNPMYVGLSVIYLGVTFLTGSAWPLALLALPLTILHRGTIPMEERIIADVFGAEYRAYASRVRRWL